MKLYPESQEYISLLVKNEDWLMSRILQYAKKHDFTKYTSTLQEAWRLSVGGTSESLILAVKSFGMEPPELHPDDHYANDPITKFGRKEARLHRERGVTLSMFLSLMKYYRQSYCDLFREAGLEGSLLDRYNLFTCRCFDRIELGYINEWTSLSPDKQLNELQEKNRSITNEKNKYLTVFESLFTPIILLDENSRIINFNLRAAQLFEGIEIAGSIYYRESQSAASLKVIDDKIGNLIDSMECESMFETELSTLEGRKYFKVLLKKSLDISDKYRGTIVLLQDLTEQHNTEEILKEAKQRAEEADRLKTSFLANMSHEIRTPMNAIVGFTELLLNESYGKKESQSYLKLIRNSSKDLLHIIEDIIDIAKLESKQLKIKYRACRIYNLFTDLHAVFTETLRRYGTNDVIELKLSVDPEQQDLEIFTDGERLKQVISNFLSNAAKFTNEGFIEYGYRPVDNGNLLFFVRDSGTGVPEDMKERIFDRFFQLEEHQAMNLGGAGLGLAICKNIVSLLGGKIWMESSLGRGSDFYFQLPCKEVSPSQKKTGLPQKLRERNDFQINLGGKRILIAEDDEMNYLFLDEILKRCGASTLRACNGLEAIDIAESTEKLDLILMDIKMPEVNGLEAARYISAIYPNMPIIAQTAFALDGDKAKCLEAGCCAYITKPINRQQLFMLLERYVLSGNRAREILLSVSVKEEGGR